MKDSAALWHKKAMAIQLDERSLALRRKIINILGCSKRGHLGSSLSLVEIIRVLYDDILRYDKDKPDWSERDRCILSKGHGCLTLYAMLADKKFFPEEETRKFCKRDSLFGGHPDAGKIPGVEASTGALGHGLSIGVGMAINARFEKNKVRVFAILGDGECNEGSVWEAAMAAGKHGLENLTVLVDYNKYQSYDATSKVQELEPFAEKWRAFGFATAEVNGHDLNDLRQVLENLPDTLGKPTAIICHTVKGKGISFVENNLAWHHKSSLNDDDILALLQALGAEE